MQLSQSGRRALAALAVATLAACSRPEGGSDNYARDGDSGAAAPATVLTPDNPGAPDSTAGVSRRTGQPGVAGDRQGQNGTGAIPNTPEAGREAARAATAGAPVAKP